VLGTIQHLRILEWRLMYNYVLHAIIVKWAKEEIEHYADMFRRQVYSLNDQDEQTVEKCLRYTRQHYSIVSHRNI
jgi:hypothetical protein